MYDLVAATLISTPARSGTRRSAIAASGDSGELHSAITSAPPRFAASVEASRSGLLPDCEIAMNTTPRRSGCASYSELNEGAAEEVRTFARDSIRYLANVAALSELPRAQVTTARGFIS